MAISVVFDGKTRKQPGVYSRILSGIKNPALSSDYGKVLIIDNGFGAGFGGGSGINGTLASGQDAVYRGMSDIDEFRDFVKGGIWWDLAVPLFRPNKGFNGVSSIDFVRAATTVPAEITYIFTGNGVYGGSDGGTIVIQMRDEGLVGNGAEVNSIVTRGYAGLMAVSPTDPTKYVIGFFRGTYKGVDPEGDHYNNRAEADCPPELLVVTPEFDNIQTLIDWMGSDQTFGLYFKLKTGTKSGTGAVGAGDLAVYVSNNLASGGTEAYSTENLDLVLDEISEFDYVFLLSDQYGDDAMDEINTRIQYHIENEAKYDKFLFVGGQDDSTGFTGAGSSEAIAEYFNSNKVVVIHGAPYKASKYKASGFKRYTSLYKTAYVLGRIAGLPPQVPGTSKSIDIDGEVHPIKYNDRDRALDHGVLHTFKDSDYNAFVINQAINSLQDNKFLWNNQGKSHLIQIERIKAQLNKEIIVNAKRDLLGDPNGVNRNTLTERDVYDWLDGYLTSRHASATRDDLIISHQDITVERRGDGYFANYGFFPNSEINKLFFTGFMLD